MQEGFSTLPVRSRQQAMDWGLVLASQGMEPVIDLVEGGQWVLRVPTAEMPAALEAIGLYRKENRRWPWRREIPSAGVLFDGAAICWVVLIATFYWADQGGLRAAGLMDSNEVAAGQWWRLFTATWLHGDLGHLATNASIGLFLLGLVMGHYGTGLGLLAACLAGAGGNLFAMLVAQGPHRSLGASGLVMACLGLLMAQSLNLGARWKGQAARLRDASHRRLRRGLTLMVPAVMLFVLLGVAPGTDILAHFGGFCCGAMLGLPLSFLDNPARSNRLNLVAGALFGLVTLASWWLALARAAP